MTTTLKLWLSTIKPTLTNIGALAIFAAIYAVLLATFFRFIWIREATVSQVLFTYAFMILIPAEFFIFQAAIIGHARDRKFRWRAIVIDAVKFFVITIPVLLLAWLLYYLVGKIAGRWPAPILPALPFGAVPPKQPIHWPTLLFGTLRFLLFGIVLPLVTIHLWIAIAGGEVRSLFAGGAGDFLKRIGAALSRAFSSESVLVYAIGLILFVLIPYALLFVPITIRGNKTDFALFILRLLFSFAFTLIGWVVTLTTLARFMNETMPAVEPKAVAKFPAEAAA